jgi:hypothetical protein
MSTGKTERLWKLETRANELILEGKRDEEPLLQFLQDFVYGVSLGFELWEEVYELLGMRSEYIDFAAASPGNDSSNFWTVPVVKGITCNKVVAALRKRSVDVNLYRDDLDANVTENDRDPNHNGSYVISFLHTVEADEGNKNLSANQLKERNHKGITLLERLLLELGYFLATGKNLDVKNITLCTGSRLSNGVVPRVRCGPGSRWVCVSWCHPVHARGDLRSRSAVSLPV